MDPKANDVVAGEPPRRMRATGKPSRGFALLSLSLASASLAGADLFIAPLGSDAGDGSRELPFATLEGARDALRTLKEAGPLPEKGATVWLRGGLYTRESTFVLDARDSGAPGAPVAYRSAPGEEVRLLGGKRIPSFRPVTDPAIRARLDAGARGRVVEADLRALGITDLGTLRSRGFGRANVPAHLELFFGGKRMTLARWPDAGFVQIAGLGGVEPSGDGHGGEIGKLEEGFNFEGDRPSRWRSLEDVWVHGYWCWDWANSYEKVASVDLGRRLVKTAPPHGLYGFRKGQRFYWLNVLEELDAPGEYWVDARTGVLYFYPPGPLDGVEALVSVLETPLVEIHDAAHLAIRGLALECARGDGLVVSGGEDVRVAGCVLRNLGNYAVRVRGGRGHAVTACDIHGTGDGGVSFEGGNRATIEPSGHEGANNHVHHIAEWSKCYQPAFLVGGVGTRIANNLIHDHPHCPILFTGNEHAIELNEIHHVCLETGDVGAIYTGRDWTFRGTRIRHNFIHHTGGVGMGSMGVYLDDCVSGEIVTGNVFYQVQRAAFIGGGRDNLVENNIFVDCHPAVMIDGRGLDRSPVWHDMVYEFMKGRLAEMKPREPPYSERYPKLHDLEAWYAKDEGVPPEGNIVARNICFGGEWLTVHWHATPDMVRVEENLVGEDPRFVDASSMDFRLRDDSPAWKMGFQRIPFERIGLIDDEDRRALPR